MTLHGFHLSRTAVALCLAMGAWSAELPTPKTSASTVSEIPAQYILSPDDEFTLRSLQAKELADKVFRIDQSGEVNLPLLGRVVVAGNTVRQAEALLASKLKTYYLDPDVSLTISGLHSEPVSVLGAVGTPGIQQVKSKTTLLDVLSSAGGIRPDAGPVAKVTRLKANGSIPHATAHETASGDMVADIDLKSLLEAKNPSEN